MYCVMRASVPSLHNVYRRYDILMILYSWYAIACCVDKCTQVNDARIRDHICYTPPLTHANMHARATMQERKSSFSYDYARDFDKECAISAAPAIPEGHYEFDTNDEPFWEPASVEDELRNQLMDLTIPEESLT